MDCLVFVVRMCCEASVSPLCYSFVFQNKSCKKKLGFLAQFLVVIKVFPRSIVTCKLRCTTLVCLRFRSVPSPQCCHSTFFYPMFANCECPMFDLIGHFLNVIFFHQIVASLPTNATRIVRFLKTFSNFGFLKNIDGFSLKKKFMKR